MKAFKFKIGENNYEVSVVKTKDNVSEVIVNGQSFEVEVEREEETLPRMDVAKPRAKSPTKSSTLPTQATGGPPEPINSPLPGVILDVTAKEGQSVNEGDKLLLLEAMKMENIIKAPFSGIIVRIKVKQGDSVMEGDTLIEMRRL